MKLHAQTLVIPSDPVAFGEALTERLGGEWSAAAGTVTVGTATCDLHAWPDGLRLDAYADDEFGLQACERAVDAGIAAAGGAAPQWVTRPSTVPGAPPAIAPVYTFPPGDDE